mgnify:CR=1 FL=1
MSQMDALRPREALATEVQDFCLGPKWLRRFKTFVLDQNGDGTRASAEDLFPPNGLWA